MKLLQKELQSAMKKLPQFPRPNSYSNEDGSGDHHVDIIGDVVSIGNVKVRYLIIFSRSYIPAAPAFKFDESSKWLKKHIVKKG